MSEPMDNDPMTQMSRFGSEFEGGAMPLPAAEVRRRGDRIRRRRNALVSGATALAVAAIAVPVFAIVGSGGGNEPIPPAKQPDGRVAPLSEADLLTEADVKADAGRGLSWTMNYSGVGETQAAFSPCAHPIVDLGATAVFQRDFVLTADEGGDGTDNRLDESIATFDSPKEAQQAADTLKKWYDECEPPGAATSGPDAYRADTWRSVDVGADGTGEWMVSQYGPATASPGTSFDASPDDGWFLDTGIVVQGDRVAIVTRMILGQDYDFLPEDDSPTANLLPLAADRLRPDSVDQAAGDLSAANLPTSDDAVFFSGSDWVEDTTTHGAGDAPNLCLTHALTDLGAADTWRRDFKAEPELAPGADDYLVATVSEFASSDQASEAAATLIGDADQCDQHLSDAEPGTFELFGNVPVEGVADRAQVITASWATPEVKDARTILQTGIAQRDNRLLVLTQVYIGQDYPIDAEHPDGTVATTLINAAPRITGEPVVPPTADGSGETLQLTPEGYGDLTLGATTREARRAQVIGGVNPPTGGSCGTFIYADLIEQGIGGYLSTDGRVVQINAPGQVKTPEGIGVNSTLDEVRAAYPQLQETDSGLYSVVPDGYTDREYVFTIRGGQVVEMGLSLDTNACVN